MTDSAAPTNGANTLKHGRYLESIHKFDRMGRFKFHDLNLSFGRTIQNNTIRTANFIFAYLQRRWNHISNYIHTSDLHTILFPPDQVKLSSR
jgi:hypothetical protein